MTNNRRVYESAVAIPGRSNTRSKAPGKMFDVDAGPMYASNGHGAVLVDVDGREYIDMLCALGAISLGYRFLDDKRVPPSLNVLSLPHVHEVDAANMIIEHVAPWASRVRFTRTGSEATHAAYRIARRATGRQYVLMGDWAYHGWHEWCEKRQDGLPESINTILFPHGADFSRGYMKSTHHAKGIVNVAAESVAAVFIEPHRWEPVDRDWLMSVRKFCSKHGIVMVMDEMIYGGRWALGGATEFYGVQPDLACYGKAIGNGAPVACVVGGDLLAEHGQLVSGTYAGDCASAFEATCTLQYLNKAAISQLWRTGDLLQRGLQTSLRVTGWDKCASAEGAPVHQRLRFHDPRQGREFSAQMASRGVLWHPDCVNVCLSHTPEQIHKVVSAVEESLDQMEFDGSVPAGKFG